MQNRIMTAVLALAVLGAAGCGSSSSTTSTTSTAAGTPAATTALTGAKCSATIAIEGPFTGPVAQLGLEQLHFAELAVADDNAANKTNVTLDQDDTPLTPS